MGRYDRKRNKKPSISVSFIFSLILARLLSIGITLFVIKNYKVLFDSETTANIDELSQNLKISDSTAPNRSTLAEIEPDSNSSGQVQTTDIYPSNLMQNDDLPDLLSSDAVIRQSVISLSPALSEWFSTTQLIRHYVVIINDFARSVRIPSNMSFLRLMEPFSVEQDLNDLIIAEKSYHRYDALAMAIQTIDIKSAVKLYLKFKPLMLQVFSEFNYPEDITLDSYVKKALSEIVYAPVIEGNIPLTRPSVYYKFADQNLESSNAIHKQMIRMGPANTRIIQQKCRDFLVEMSKADI